MGNQISESKASDFEVYDVKRIYWDGDGNLRYGNTTRKRDDEILQILQADTNDESDETKLWMIIPSRWIRLWLQCVYLKVGDPPGKIDMYSLLQFDSGVEGGWRPKKNLQPPVLNDTEDSPGHYRRVSLPAWLQFVELYGVDGYAIAVRGTPYDDISRWRVFKDPKIIDINRLPEPITKKNPKAMEVETKKK